MGKKGSLYKPSSDIWIFQVQLRLYLRGLPLVSRIIYGSLENPQISCFSVVNSWELSDKGHRTTVQAGLVQGSSELPLTLFALLSLQCVPPDEACTSLDASMIWAMMQNKKTFTKPLAVIHQQVEAKGAFGEAQ